MLKKDCFAYNFAVKIEIKIKLHVSVKDKKYFTIYDCYPKTLNQKWNLS